jgi:hypothetical protein
MVSSRKSTTAPASRRLPLTAFHFSGPVFSENAQRYFKALLPVALLLIFVPLVDIGLRSMAAEAGSLQWRFGAVGLLFGNLGTIILGLSLAGAIAVVTENRTLLRVIGAVSLVLALSLIALLALFALDAVQVRRLVPVPAKRGVLLSSAGAMFSALFAAVALGLGGRAALKASRVAGETAPRRTKAAPSPLVATPPAPVAPRPRPSESV